MRTFLAILFILLGLVGIAGGIWGLSLRSDVDVNANILNAAQGVLDAADGAMETVDGWVSDLTGGKSTVTDWLNSLVGDSVNLKSDLSIAAFAWLHAVEILLCGIIGIETGLLMLKSRR